jgi:hypothetical protein
MPEKNMERNAILFAAIIKVAGILSSQYLRRHDWSTNVAGLSWLKSAARPLDPLASKHSFQFNSAV